MAFRMARPTRRSGSSFNQFRKRVPADVLRVARGHRASVLLPSEGGNEADIAVAFSLGNEVKFSLQTNDPALTKRRHAAAADQLERLFAAYRNGPRPLFQMERVHLAGIAYEDWATTFAEAPGEPEIWQLVLEANNRAATTDDGLEKWFGQSVDELLARKSIVTDTESRKALIREVARAQNEAAMKLKKNAEGDYTPDPAAARFPKWEGIKSEAPTSTSTTSLTFDNLLDRWERESAKAPSSLIGFRQHVRAFKEHLKHNDAKRVTRADVIAWKDALLSQKLAAKTINGSYLASIRTLYRLAKCNDLIATDPTEGIGVQSKRKAGEGRLPYDDAEVGAILALADAQTDARLRWIPWLLALTGARVGEIAQLWSDRVVTVNGVLIIRIAPADDGGTIKNAGSERDVPLHPEILSRGFLEFVKTRPNGGPLFYGGKQAVARPRRSNTAGHASDGAINRVREWIRENGFTDPRKAPSHAFRHWFKTTCADLDIPDSVADAIQGHSDQSAAAGYRKISLAKMTEAIRKIPVPKAAGF